jgi:sugar lactone lactonase YvrE
MAEPQVLDPELPSKVLYQFPIPTWIENIAVRSNGELLVTLLTSPELYLVSPSDPKEAVLVHKFDEVLAVTGIIEVKEDVFYVGGGNYSLSAFSNEQGSYRIWEVDLTGFGKDSKAAIKQVAHLPGAGLANGFELLSKEAGTILIADSVNGIVWKVNVNDGKVEKVIELDEMKPPPPPALQIGINGIKVRDGYLYWSNTVKMLFCRIKIDEEGKPTGSVEVLERDILIDDFCFDNHGNAWLTQHGLNVLGVVKAAGGVVTAAGRLDKLTIAGGTACQFGRTSSDADILYFVTTGGMSAPVNGTEVEGGKVVAIDTAKFHH